MKVMNGRMTMKLLTFNQIPSLHSVKFPKLTVQGAPIPATFNPIFCFFSCSFSFLLVETVEATKLQQQRRPRKPLVL